MGFRIRGLPMDPFRRYFAMTDAELARHAARRCAADAKPGFPCRVSLEDAGPGESLVLVNYVHQPAATPFRASHAVYVRAAAEVTFDRANEVPDALRRRVLSVRGYDADGDLIDADLCDGRDVEACIERFLDDRRSAYLHLHYAKAGCYAARVDRP
jgi:hypothetical protein